MICELQINFFFHPFGILWYKFLSYIEVLHVLSELSKLLELSELIELPEVFEVSLLVLGERLRRRLLLNLLPRPLLIQWPWLELALACCLSIMETTWRGTNKENNTCANDKGKQINKQTRSSTCRGMDVRGSMVLCNLQSLLHSVSEYTEGLWRCSEKCGVQYIRL